jgi:hypothetical protein
MLFRKTIEVYYEDYINIQIEYLGNIHIFLILNQLVTRV